MSLLLPDVVAYFENQSIGTRGTTLFYGIVPDFPDALVTCFEYPGPKSEPNLGKTTMNNEFPRLQVIARGVKDDYDTPRQKLQDVVTALTKIANSTLPGGGATIYKAFEGRAVSFLQRDDNFRVYFVVNFEVTKAYSAS